MEQSQKQLSPLQKLKTFGMYATIALLVASAIIAIFMIFFGPEQTLLQVLATVAIIYATTLLCANSAARMDSQYSSTRIMSIAAMILNLLWALPWVMIIWGCFDYVVADFVWRLVWTALALSVYCMIMANQLPFVTSNFKGYEMVQQSVPVVLITFVLINVLAVVWTFEYAATFSVISKLVAAEIILLIVQWAVPEILIRNQRKQNPQNPQQNNPQNNLLQSPKNTLLTQNNNSHIAPNNNVNVNTETKPEVKTDAKAESNTHSETKSEKAE